MSGFQEARDALVRVVRRVFPDAKPVPGWAGVEAWGAPRPEGAVAHGSTGTYDPARTVIGIADRKSGPTVYFLDPGDYFVLDTHRALLEGAGLKLGRGCIMHTRKGPLPTEALEALFRLVKERDAKAATAAAGAAGASAPAAKGAAKKPAKAPAQKKAAAPRRMAKPQGEGASAVDAYLAELPEDQRAALERLRMQVRAAAPKATEGLSYGMPTFFHEGILVHMAAFRDHVSLFPGSGGVTAALQDGLKGFETSKGTIRFTNENPLPAAVVRKIVKMRLAENEARAAARAAKKALGKGAKGTVKGAAKKPAKAPAKKPAKKASGKAAKSRARSS